MTLLLEALQLNKHETVLLLTERAEHHATTSSLYAQLPRASFSIIFTDAFVPFTAA